MAKDQSVEISPYLVTMDVNVCILFAKVLIEHYF